MINFNQIVAPLEQVIVQWVSTYHLTTPVLTLHDLTNGEFFIFMLGRIKHFTMIEDVCYTVFADLSISERISRMKLLGRSIMRYLNSELLIDTGELKLNFVEMCKGNREESIRMIIMLMGIIIRNQLIKHELEEYIKTCQEESAALLNIMADYAGKIGEGQGQLTGSPENKQNRLITKLEIVQDQVEFYQEYTHQLQTEIEGLRDESSKQMGRLSEYEKREKEMLLKIEQLQITGEQYAKELYLHEQREELLNSKINNNRQVVDEVVDRLMQQLQKEKTETEYYKSQLEKYISVDAVNNELTLANSEYRVNIETIKHKLSRSLQAIKTKSAEFNQLEDRYKQLMLQNDGLKLRLELMQKSYGHNETMHYSPQQKSITCHNQLSQSFSGDNGASPLFSYQARLQELNERTQMGESLMIVQSNYIEDSKVNRQHHNKQNINTFNIIAEGKGDTKNFVDQINEEKSMQLSLQQIDELTNFKREREIEADLLLQITMDTYQNLEFLRSQLNKYRLSESKKAQRKSVFMKKVNKMFS